MTATFSVFEVPQQQGAWGFLVQDPSTGVRVRQLCKPGFPASVVMTEAEAEAEAGALCAELNAPPPPPEPEPEPTPEPEPAAPPPAADEVMSDGPFDVDTLGGGSPS